MKTAIICFAILFCATFTTATARLRNRDLSSVLLSLDDVNTFAENVWHTLALGYEWEDIEECIHNQAQAGASIVKALVNLNSSDATTARLGLHDLGNALHIITVAIAQCEGKEQYWVTFQEMVGNFTHPTNLTIGSSSFTIDGIEEYADMQNVISYCSTGQLSSCGSTLANALGKVYYGQQDMGSPDTIAAINAIPNITWTAGVNKIFNHSNLWNFKRERASLRRLHSKTNNGSNTTTTDNSTGNGRRNLVTIPSAFDSRTQWPYCIHAIRDQGPCASCWAVAASEVLSDRFCIETSRSINTVLGPQYQVSCDSTDNGCNGGYLYNAWQFLEKSGIVTETCFPYTSGNYVIPSCASFTKCQDGTAMRKYYAKTGSSKMFSGVSAIQQEIYTNGPVEAAIYVYSDLYAYTSGIYKYAWGSFIGGHAIKIIGWGTQGGVNYWIISNSWGVSWGQTGHAFIAFGQIGIETQAYAGLADLTRS